MSNYYNNTYVNLLKPGENRFSPSGDPSKVTYQTKKQVSTLMAQNKRRK